jgi:hypothetical protein
MQGFMRLRYSRERFDVTVVVRGVVGPVLPGLGPKAGGREAEGSMLFVVYLTASLNIILKM